MPRAAAARDALLEAVGATVRSIRERLDVSRRELSERSGVSERFLADLEGGQGNISVGRLAEVARALGTSAGALLDRAEASLRTSKMIALVGLRGAGKTAIGRRVAAMLGVRFIEQDELVERAAGLPLATIFALHGEAYYRRVAREVLGNLLVEPKPAVLATGGGAVTDPEAWALLRQRCRTVWLRARPEDHWDRVLAQGDLRPGAATANAQGELRALLKAREALYAQAELTVDTSKGSVDDAARSVVRHLGVEREPPAQAKRGSRTAGGSHR
jgi:XRE family transcriptional regulator, aerobic/anaerobic benzoate catabolism transcriptional regulator